MVEGGNLAQDPTVDTGSRSSIVVRAACAECGRESDPLWRGFLACRIDEPGTAEEPTVAFFCKDCAQREFGR
jgi:hypothetical protein